MESIDSGSLAYYLVWLGIFFCLSQSAMFSGLNLAFFSVSRMRLEIAVANGDTAAQRVLAMRKDSNLLLATVLWGNVAINVLLTLLADSVMAGVAAFLFSTIAITLLGEILPQAYFSRNALRMASLLAPLLRGYQLMLYPVTKTTALALDAWLGKEGINFMRERDLRQMIHKHIDSSETDLDAVEGIGALNFLAIDDVPVIQEGEPVDLNSVIRLPVESFAGDAGFHTAHLTQLHRLVLDKVVTSPHRWIILADEEDTPHWVLDADAFARALHDPEIDDSNPLAFCHRPIVTRNGRTRLGALIAQFKADISAESDAPIPHRVLLLWSEQKRIITGADILGRLFKGIGLYSSLTG